MIDKIVELLNNKNLAILGFGREGKATYNFIRSHVGNQEITIIDKNDVSDDELLVNDTNVKVISGEDYLNNLEIYDLVIKTPGISLKDIDSNKVNITSEMELLLEVNKERIIGVTGTKGKSTTSSLIANILKENGVKTIFAGNIGIPVFLMLDDAEDDTMFVLEMSSHQLEFLKFSPHIGVVLNLFEDHLDHAGSVEHYHNIKMNMFRYQDESDYMIYCQDNDNLRKKVENSNFVGQKCIIDINGCNALTYLLDDYVYYDKKAAFKKDIKENF